MIAEYKSTRRGEMTGRVFPPSMKRSFVMMRAYSGIQTTRKNIWKHESSGRKGRYQAEGIGGQYKASP
ncbi:hypothetical protein MPTK1_6g20510 [Marchantia polymorpha subsp. ruderalis]|uniref:Uncharacterized protein n=2 Tax=Marchantia polymorpha TaxID=3197 RepID=A0AAF6BU72_MARPO|nr:hypothetical protein MARPO_0045s0013 [Marchantia polymorpha]BBN15556.1 hypothetical protein Mp_6g20510 [Marchantia polymorpha subsp. ruderalis]|eukprot:PTQ39333.1 hypothetical protein MARPO_0045s0013 [Marchantia polymorpha]